MPYYGVLRSEIAIPRNLSNLVSLPDLYAFYGSLRRGMSNYLVYQNHLQFHSEHRIDGFKLYALEDYPYAVRTQSTDSIVVELFRILDEETRINIHQLELGAGYYFETFQLDELRVGIYLFEYAGNNPEVKSGDWVEFFGVS